MTDWEIDLEDTGEFLIDPETGKFINAGQITCAICGKAFLVEDALKGYGLNPPSHNYREELCEGAKISVEIQSITDSRVMTEYNKIRGEKSDGHLTSDGHIIVK